MIHVNSKRMNPWIFLCEFEVPTNYKDYAEDILTHINFSVMPQGAIHKQYLNILALNVDLLC
jgi:hypothetical protein